MGRQADGKKSANPMIFITSAKTTKDFQLHIALGERLEQFFPRPIVGDFSRNQR